MFRPQPKPSKKLRPSKKKEWQWSRRVRRKANYICARCGRQDRNTVQAHHKKMRSTHPEYKLKLSNGICVCAQCHEWIHRNPKKAAEQGYLALAKHQR